MTDTSQEQAKGFYEQKGMVRHMLILPETHKQKLKKIAGVYGLTQGEVVEVMLDQINLNMIGGHFEAKKTSKGAGKSTKADLIKKMKALTPAQMKAIEAILAGQDVVEV